MSVFIVNIDVYDITRIRVNVSQALSSLEDNKIHYGCSIVRVILSCVYALHCQTNAVSS